MEEVDGAVDVFSVHPVRADSCDVADQVGPGVVLEFLDELLAASVDTWEMC